MELSIFQQYLAQEYVPKASYISACLVSINILFMIGMSIYDSRLVNRVSLRLQTALAAYDFWLHTGSLWKTPYANGPSPLCVFFGWNMVATTLFYSFINVSIGVNLQLIFIHDKKITKRIEIGYWLVPILLSLIISIPPLALGRFGWYSYGGCYMIAPKGDEYQMKMLDLLGVQLWRSISLIYLIVIVIAVFLRLNRQVSITGPNKSRIDPEISSKATKAVKLLGYRILLYPIGMLVAYSAGIISQIYYDFGEASERLDALSYITYPLGGTLNFFAFFCDPTVHKAIKTVYNRIKNRKKKAEEDTNEIELELYGISFDLEDGTNNHNNNSNNGSDNNNQPLANIIQLL